MQFRRTTFAGLIALAAFSSAAGAQAASPRMFANGYSDIGFTLGLGNIGSAGIAFGGRFERAIKALPDMGDGTLGIQISADMWNYGDNFGTLGDYDFRYIAFGGTANYHFKVTNGKIDPFLGAGLGFSTVSTDFTGDYSSGLYFIGRAGIRYFFRPNMTLYADAGAGAATLNIGLTFRTTPAK